MEEQMSNVSREMEMLRKTQKEIQVIKNTVIEMRNAFYGQRKERGIRNIFVIIRHFALSMTQDSVI